jgi:hypothetical protein
MLILLPVAVHGQTREQTAKVKFREAKALYKDQLYASAIERLQEGLTLDPSDGYAWFFLGESLRKVGRMQEAVTAYRKTAELIPNTPLGREAKYITSGAGTGASRLGSAPAAVKTYENGDRYEGELVDDRPQGRGVGTYANGNRYDGEWVGGRRHGRGVFLYANGSRYDGEWIDGKRQGRGTLEVVKGDRYEGEWQDGFPGGSGEARISGKIFRGVWAAGCLRESGKTVAAVAKSLSDCNIADAK